MAQTRVQVIDSHTAGEPTRVVVEGGPDLGADDLAHRRKRFADGHDSFRSAVVNEPRGSDVLVGALLCQPSDSTCSSGVIFFNNVGFLGMCGHGTIGVVVTLAHLGRIGPGQHRLETPVGIVTAELHGDGRVTIENVPSYRHLRSVTVEVPDDGVVIGDVAWGGNWFYLTDNHRQELHSSRVDELTRFTLRLRQALDEAGITGRDGQPIDHIELMSETDNARADGRNFVLCPGGAWDRSPCGTGTSAKVACLADDGKLQPGETWRQESIIGSVFEATYRRDAAGAIIPSVTGSAWITAESTLLLNASDPFNTGIHR